MIPPIIKLIYLFTLFSLSSLLLAATDENNSGESRVEVPSSFNPVGSGARALGWGGAFIAVADDATAASWNPAGLIQLRNTEVAIVGSYLYRGEDNHFASNPEADGRASINNADLNYFSASIPCSAQYCGRNMVFSINYQNLYNMDRQWQLRFQDTTEFGYGSQFVDENWQLEQQGTLYALGLAWSVQASETLALGLTLNIWNDFMGDNGWQQTYKNRTLTTDFDGFFEDTSINNRFLKEKFQFRGINMNLGLLWNIYEQEEQKLMLGLVLKTPFTADIQHSKFSSYSRQFLGEAALDFSSYTQYTEKLDMPLSFGLGLSYQLSDALTIAGDIYRTAWNDFTYTDYQGRQFSPISNVEKSQSSISATWQLRLGAEYRIISQEFGKNYIIPLRAGVFYDPAPAEGGNDHFYGLSIGSGIAFENYVFDIAYQFRFGNQINQQILPNRGFSQNVREHTLYGSFFYRF